MRPFFLVLKDSDMSDSKKTTDKKLELMQEISEIADEFTLDFVKGLRKTIKDPDADDEQKAKAFREMDKVLRISKQYSERVLLAEGKNTANIGVDGKGGLPFKFVINKHYPSAPDADKDEENDTAEGDSIDE